MRDEVALTEGENATFYSFMGVTPSVTQDELNKAYRKKSRTLHPDKARANWLAQYSQQQIPLKKAKGQKEGVKVTKSKQPSQKEITAFNKEASHRFSLLGLVAGILRGSERERYDHFLRNGFPKWRGTGYYYERFRPGLFSVLFGLFIVIGGGAHYVALYLGWKKQREFVDRYIRHARRTAWGDEGGLNGIAGIPGSNGAATPPPPPAAASSEEEEPMAMQWNRKQKRAQEKENRKAVKNPKSAKAAEKAKTSGISSPVEAELTNGGAVGAKKRTLAQNGKVLIVDSVGNVFLEEKTAEGDIHEYLLDVSHVVSLFHGTANRCFRSTRLSNPQSTTRCCSSFPNGPTTPRSASSSTSKLKTLKWTSFSARLEKTQMTTRLRSSLPFSPTRTPRLAKEGSVESSKRVSCL